MYFGAAFFTGTFLTQLYNQLCCSCSLLEAALHGDPNECCFYMNLLCGVLVPLLASPLAAPRVSLVFLRLGEVAFDDTKLGMFIAVWLLLALKSHRFEDKYSNVAILCKCLDIGAVAQREACTRRGVRLW